MEEELYDKLFEEQSSENQDELKRLKKRVENLEEMLKKRDDKIDLQKFAFTNLSAGSIKKWSQEQRKIMRKELDKVEEVENGRGK